jgi:translation initiation factor IF-2
MSKVRIYDLSKELNLENRDILAICSQLDIAVKSHSSTISDEESAAIRAAAQSYQPLANSSPSDPVEPRPTANLNTNTSNPPKKQQQILQVRRSPIANAQPELVGPPQAAALAGPPVAAPPATARKVPVANVPVGNGNGAAVPAVATATVNPPAAPANRPKAEVATPLQPMKPVERPTTGDTNGNKVSEAEPIDSMVSPNGSSANSEPKNPAAPREEVKKAAAPPKPVLNKPPIVRPAAAPVGAAKANTPPRGPGEAKSGRPAPPQKPTGPKPQQIVELRRPKAAGEENGVPTAVAAGGPTRPMPLAGKPQRSTPGGAASADGKTATGIDKPTTALMAKPTMPSKAKLKKPWEEEEDPEALEKAKVAKKRRGPKINEDDDDIDLDDDEDEDDDALVSREQISLSLARPAKPKSAAVPTSKPAAGARRKPNSGGGSSYRDRRDRRHQQQNQKQERPEIVTLTRALTVQELSQILLVSETEIIRNLFLKGIAATVTQTLDLETASTVAEEMGILVDKAKEQSAAIKVTEMVDSSDAGSLQRRPPVVTIMGHVDHGKTSLLDSIRKTKVAAGEAGGITQHIGAYHVDVEHNGAMQQVVFLDTPGHEAFTAMRARGARVTDVAILVVAADDGVQPQTIEAISHAKAAGVPIIVAINKVDKEAAQPDRVKQELTEYELVPEEWGGSTVMVPVSALTGLNLDTLLEMILLVSEVEDLNANPDRLARGTVIEAHLDKAKGPVATLLVQNGTLHVGDILVAGSALGKVRAMVDDRLQRVKNASPSFAVEVLGLSDVPAAGDEFEVYKDEKEARSVATNRADEQRESRLIAAISSRQVSLNTLSGKAQKGELKELNIVLKADVQGSLEAILGSLKQLPQGEVQVRVLFAAPGEISETDIDLAAASEAVMVGFNTTLAPGARQAADRLGVDVREYNIIYAMLDDIQAAMEEELGQVEVRAVFTVGKGAVAGCYVQSGKAIRNCKIRIRRKAELVFEGNLDSLKRMKEDTREVASGYECGVGLDNFNAWQEGDIIETFRMVSKRRTLNTGK